MIPRYPAGDGPAFQVLHEHYCVAALIIEQLVYQLSAHQNSETAGPLAFAGAEFDVLSGRVFRVRNGGVRQEPEGEPGTGIRNVNDDRAPGAQQRGAHALARVVFAAVLDGVHEQFAEGNPDVVARLRGQVGQDLADVMGGPFHRLHAATELERHPLREGGEDAEIFAPGIGLQRLLNHVGQGGRGERLVNVTISTVPESADNLLGVGVSRDNHL